LDAFDYLKMEGSVVGSLPSVLPRGAEAELDPYSEEFIRQRPGLITAESTRPIKVKNSLELQPKYVDFFLKSFKYLN
jgi:hypothetical protein